MRWTCLGKVCSGSGRGVGLEWGGGGGGGGESVVFWEGRRLGRVGEWGPGEGGWAGCGLTAY